MKKLIRNRILIIFGSFFLVSILFMYLIVSGNWTYFIFRLKWFLRIVTPFVIIYLFYLGNSEKKMK